MAGGRGGGEGKRTTMGGAPMVNARAGRLIGTVAVALFVAFAGTARAAGEPQPFALTQALGRVTLFAGLTDAERRALETVATLRHGAAGERVIEQGTTLDRMFIILEGQAEVRVSGHLVATLPSGQLLVGEVEFLDGLPASADVVLLQEADLVELDSAALVGLMGREPRLGYVLMREIAAIESRRLRAMNPK